ncbi:HNH endonuclease signature motif containing protein [Pantoea dispersa]|uniref:HNH endonuclease signature motif containing protein n=1 Tax=Pantoea dispersa TaxID=59814 RepID=UPI0039BE870C
MLNHYQAKLLEEIYLEDLPHIIYPATAARDLQDTALPNRIIQEWDLPQGYSLFVSRYHSFHWQRPWMAYQDTLNDIKSGKVVLLRNDNSGHAMTGVFDSFGNLRSDLPMYLHSRLSYLISHQLKRPVYYVRPSSPVQYAQTAKTINSKAAGRLLAAGGVYNGNVEGFRKTAEQLGGDAIKGYDQVLNETTSGTMIAAASLLVIRNPMAAEELTSYLGKYKKAHVLLNDMNVTQLSYLRRDRAEYNTLRGQFNSTVRPGFLRSLSNHPDALSTFNSDDMLRLANGNVPPGWQVHHKIPLDDGGTNDFDNLILIQNSPYHSALSKTQAIITKDLPYNASTEVLWPSPNGVVYPIKK